MERSDAVTSVSLTGSYGYLEQSWRPKLFKTCLYLTELTKLTAHDYS